MNFCAVYINSNKEWIISSIISISIQLIVLKILGSLFAASFRELAKRYYNINFIVRTYTIVLFIIKYIL